MLKLLTYGSEIRLRGIALPALRLMRGRVHPADMPATKFIALSRAILFLVFAIASTALIGWLTAQGPHPLIVISVTAGALVAGLAGFAFSAVSGALVMHWVAPITIVPVLLACSITTQLFSIAKLRRTMQWRRTAPFLLGGLLGIPLGAALLRDTNPRLFAVSFGAFLIVYGSFMLFKPGLVVPRGGRLADAACGLIGGITGGAIAFPARRPRSGAACAVFRRTFSAAWCSLSSW